MPYAKLLFQAELRNRNFKRGLSQMRGSLNLFKSTLRAVFRTTIVAGFFLTLRAGFRMVSSTIRFFTQNITSTIGEMAKLNTAAVRTATILSKGGSGFEDAFEAVTQQARELSTQVQNTAMEIQEGLFTAAIAGYNLEDSFIVATSAMKMAQIAGHDFKSTIDGVIGVVNAFHFSMQQMPVIADMITTAFSNSKLTLQGFFTAIKYVAAGASVALGDTVETFTHVTAAIMTMSQAGLNASKAGVYLRSAILKLNSATSKVSSVLAHYGVNIYKADAESKKFADTLIESQKAVIPFAEALERLKYEQAQIANSQGVTSSAYKAISKEIDETTSIIGDLEKGMNNVHKLFMESGGKMKPFLGILQEIKKSGATEAIMKAFGIRSGQGIAMLLDNIDLMEDYSAQLEEAAALTKLGESITTKMFGKMISAVGVQWNKIKNSMTASFSVVADAFFAAISPALTIVQETFSDIYKNFEKWKSPITNIFKGLGDVLSKPFTNLMGHLKNIISTLDNVFATSTYLTVPIFKYSTITNDSGVTSGVITKTEKTVTGKEGMSAKLNAVMESLSSLFIANFKAGLDSLKPEIEFLGNVLTKTIVAQLIAKASVFVYLGSLIGKGLIKALPGGVQIDKTLRILNTKSWTEAKDILDNPDRDIQSYRQQLLNSSSRFTSQPRIKIQTVEPEESNFTPKEESMFNVQGKFDDVWKTAGLDWFSDVTPRLLEKIKDAKMSSEQAMKELITEIELETSKTEELKTAIQSQGDKQISIFTSIIDGIGLVNRRLASLQNQIAGLV